jgi:hypothetical protein
MESMVYQEAKLKGISFVLSYLLKKMKVWKIKGSEYPLDN